MQRYFKFPDKVTLQSILEYSKDTITYKLHYPNHTIYEIGLILEQPEVMDDDGTILTEAVLADGYHVNVLAWGSWDDTRWKPFEIAAPSTPLINWT